VALAGVMRALDSDVAMTNDRLKDLSLLAPERLTKTIADPADRITDIRVPRWVEQISERLPRRGRSRGQATPVCLKPQASSPASLRSLGWQHLISDRARLASNKQFSAQRTEACNEHRERAT